MFHTTESFNSGPFIFISISFHFLPKVFSKSYLGILCSVCFSGGWYISESSSLYSFDVFSNSLKFDCCLMCLPGCTNAKQVEWFTDANRSLPLWAVGLAHFGEFLTLISEANSSSRHQSWFCGMKNSHTGRKPGSDGWVSDQWPWCYSSSGSFNHHFSLCLHSKTHIWFMI